ncbi:MAG TPA: N-acetylmuramoyl-L-alanine amidase [Longimicrobium sp.]|nr:N-acetylmuramoyl-L-alanine amidase [Longimicrobium sp.]
MKIVNHLLVNDDGSPVRFVKTPNMGGEFKPTILVMHFTAGSSANESINWLANPEAKASAHIVIGRDGKVTQQVPFNRVAWHAGKSEWKGIVGLNSHSIGIELDNPGKMVKKGDHWAAVTFGGSFPDSDVLVATHKNESSPAGWYKYPEAQLAVAREVAKAIVQAYGLKEVIGHDDISPGRKVDPGPAFPMDSFRAAVLGGAAPAAQTAAPAQPAATSQPAAQPAGSFFTVTAELNIRSGPGASNPTVQGSPLASGTVVQGFEDNGGWKRVAVAQGSKHGVTGWVSAKFLKAAVQVPGLAGQPAGV